ncbi:MAG TPA: T9SS type A sorting domain-containing protein, partial [Bacteroidales bacterium]|nr:T9SS type A sorting domain-containing protein [Bacteroidales bacterium]
FSNITLDSCAIFEPIGGRVSKGTNTYYSVHNLADSVITDTVKILPATVYNLHICGVQVTSLNKNNLSAIPGVSAGTVSYNSDNKTLALNGATMSTTGNTCCILSRIDSMKIDVVGTNNLMGNGWSPISFEGDNSGTIEGSGTLNINNSADNGGIFIRNGLLNIKNCTLNVTAGDRGISSPSGEKTLTFDRATVSATGTNGGSIVGFKQIDFINCDIIQPEDAMFNDTVKAICDASGNIIKTEVKIAPTYIIIFAAPENGTLTVKLNNADIISGDKVFKDSEITITATPDANYKLKTLTVNGTAFESGNTHNVVADVNIVAEFEKEDGIEEIDAQDITLYPNPVKDILYIETEEAIKAVHIYNVQGAVVVESIGDVREINLAHLPAGIYTLRVEIGKTVSTLRIIKN